MPDDVLDSNAFARHILHEYGHGSDGEALEVLEGMVWRMDEREMERFGRKVPKFRLDPVLDVDSTDLGRFACAILRHYDILESGCGPNLGSGLHAPVWAATIAMFRKYVEEYSEYDAQDRERYEEAAMDFILLHGNIALEKRWSGYQSWDEAQALTKIPIFLFPLVHSAGEWRMLKSEIDNLTFRNKFGAVPNLKEHIELERSNSPFLPSKHGILWDVDRSMFERMRDAFMETGRISNILCFLPLDLFMLAMREDDSMVLERMVDRARGVALRNGIERTGRDPNPSDLHKVGEVLQALMHDFKSVSEVPLNE